MSTVSSSVLDDLVEKISNLTLVEASELASALKEKLGLPDVSFANAPASGAVGAGTSGENAKAAPVKFALFISKADKQVAAIKALKVIFKDFSGKDPTLMELKSKLEGLPCKILGDLPKDKAEKYLNDLKEAGCECELKGEE